jgi:hypothetical protein
MAATPTHPATRTILARVHHPLNHGPSTTSEFGTAHSGRLPRFAYLTRRRHASTASTAPPQGLTTPTATLGIGEPTQEGVM